MNKTTYVNPIRTRTKLILGALIVVLVIAIGYLSMLSIQLNADKDQALRNSTSAATQNKIAAVDLCEQVKAQGKRCVVDTEDLQSGKQAVQGLPGVQGIRGVPGLPGESGAAGVNGTNGINGLAGVDGVIGPRGPPGADGTDGASGADGQPGIQGQQGSKGDQGESGQNGANGQDGRGITSVDCNDVGQFVVNYDDGESDTVDSSDCRAGDLVDAP